MRWQVGVITVPARRNDLLPQTLSGLDRAGFSRPRLFVDGEDPDAHESWEHWLPFHGLTFRSPAVGCWANWFLSLSELYLRDPAADFYHISQDDVLYCRDVREYCEAFPGFARPDGFWSERSYLNLWTGDSPPALGNPDLAAAHGRDGWFRSNQLGCGALALVFPNAGVRTLLASRFMINRPNDERDNPERQSRNVDGSISEALCRSEPLRNREPWTEWCHRPSLVQHAGEVSSISGRRWAGGATDWPGADWSPLPLLDRPAPPPDPAEWEAERERIRAALAADTIRMDKAETPAERDRLARWIEIYRARLAAHEARRPKPG